MPRDSGSLADVKRNIPVPTRWKDKQEGQVALNRSSEFCLKLTYRYICRKLTLSLGRDHFGPKGYTLNRLGRGLLGYYIPNIKAIGLIVSDKNICSCFPYISLCKTRNMFQAVS